MRAVVRAMRAGAATATPRGVAAVGAATTVRQQPFQPQKKSSALVRRGGVGYLAGSAGGKRSDLIILSDREDFDDDGSP